MITQHMKGYYFQPLNVRVVTLNSLNIISYYNQGGMGQRLLGKLVYSFTFYFYLGA